MTMADDRSRTSRPSWRGEAETSPLRPKERERKYKWTERGAGPAVSPQGPKSRSLRLLFGLVGFAGCLILTVWLIWLLNPPQPAAIVLVGANYATNLAVPHNALGWEGLLGIERLSKTPRPWAVFNPASLQLIRSRRSKVLDRADQWGDLVADLQRGFGEQTLIIVLALHGGSGPDGAYLMPNLMSQPEDRLAMKDVIASMKKLPPEKQKILVLEGAQVAGDWRLGMLHNDFARQLKELEPDIREVQNLWVLSGCDVDQQCWPSEGLGRTVFTHYIMEALRGKATGRDQPLTLEGLYRYVRENVGRWAWNARGALQEPVLLPGTENQPGGESAAAPTPTPTRPDPGKVHLAMAENAEAPAPPPVPDRASLAQAWLRFGQLDALVPHPTVYSPWRWRAYRAALVRHQQLLRAGDTESARSMARQLSLHEQALEKERFLRNLSASTETSLVMNAVAGGVVTTPAPPQDFIRFAETSNQPAAEKIWKAIKARPASSAAEDGPGRSWRSRLDDYLLELAGEEPAKNLARAADRIRTSKGSDDPLPAEAHFLVMLKTYLPPLKDRPPPFWGLVKAALRVRRLAEREAVGLTQQPAEYPYSEQIHPWIKTLVERADTQRRLGEDRLFAADERDWGQAREALARAEEIYRQIVRQAGIIRHALATRDRVLSSLPDYARWLVYRSVDDPRDELAGQVEALWGQTHRLVDLLERRRDGAEPDLTSLDQTAKAVDQGFKKVVQQFAQQRATTEKARLKNDWEAATTAAAVAFPDNAEVELRTRIWDRLDNLRKNDLEVAEKVGASSAAPEIDEPEPDQAQRTAERARRRAALQGSLALAALGQQWFQGSTLKDPDRSDYQKTLEHVRGLPNDERAEWWLDAVREGDRIGRSWRLLAGEILTLANEERGISDFAAFQSRLAKADRLSRLIDGGAVPPASSATEPAARYRQARVRDLLVWMADRAWRDHWYDENPKAKPYYQEVVKRLIDDANKLFGNLGAVHQPLRDRLNAKGQLGLTGPARQVLTSEQGAMVSYQLDDPGPQTVPPGIPVVKPRPDPLLELEDGVTDYRTAPRQAGASISFRLTSPSLRDAERRQADHDPKFSRPFIQRAAMTLDGFFRGQIFSYTTECELHPVPDRVAIGPAPPDPPLASIAVKASEEIIRRYGEGTGSIAIVLDCSGSMMYDYNYNIIPKWENAKKALAQVLRQVPKGTTVSLWTFGQLPQGVDRAMLHREDPILKEPERTIRPLRTPLAWDPNQINDLVRELDQLRPFLGTPLVEAMWRAAEADLVNAKSPIKTLLVLSDGKDERFKESKALNPTGTMDIPTFIGTKFRPLGIRINLVHFSEFGNPAEVEEARRVFSKTLESLDPPGKFVVAADLGQLTESLRKGIQQKLVCQVAKADGTPLGDEPLDVTKPDEKLKWWSRGLAPAPYKLRVTADTTYNQEVNLEKGDLLVVQLVDGPGGGIGFTRALYSDDDDCRDAVKQDGGDWRLAVQPPQHLRRNQLDRLQIMVALEPKSSTDPLRQLKPRWTWFQLGAQDLANPGSAIALRWRERALYPAAVWQLEVPQWPADPAGAGLARPIFKSWWWDSDRTLPGVEAFERDDTESTQKIRVENNQMVTIEDINLENHLVEVQPGEPPQTRNCLVIRLEYPKDSPYFIAPGPFNGVDTAGYEHRFYSQAGKYTGLFWPVNRSQFERIRKFQLVSLNRLRAEAAKQKNAVDINLAEPRANVKPPPPPQAIGK
jgi:hypothetical protein